MYCTARSTLIRGSPSSSNCISAIVPVASCSSAWSMRIEIGLPGLSSPSTRCSFRIWRVRLAGMCSPRAYPASRPEATPRLGDQALIGGRGGGGVADLAVPPLDARLELQERAHGRRPAHRDL